METKWYQTGVPRVRLQPQSVSLWRALLNHNVSEACFKAASITGWQSTCHQTCSWSSPEAFRASQTADLADHQLSFDLICFVFFKTSKPKLKRGSSGSVRRVKRLSSLFPLTSTKEETMFKFQGRVGALLWCPLARALSSAFFSDATQHPDTQTQQWCCFIENKV